MKSHPEVFIIESLNGTDETQQRLGGRILSQILTLSGNACEYRYIQSKRELKWAVDLFKHSDFRYLHLSCCGNPTTMSTALDDLSFAALGRMLRPVLKNRGLFVSACSMMNGNLADAILPGSECFSIVGPKKDIEFGDGALWWASFYHLMFKRKVDAMKRADMIEAIDSISTTFSVPLRYY